MAASMPVGGDLQARLQAQARAFSAYQAQAQAQAQAYTLYNQAYSQ